MQILSENDWCLSSDFLFNIWEFNFELWLKPIQGGGLFWMKATSYIYIERKYTNQRCVWGFALVAALPLSLGHHGPSQRGANVTRSLVQLKKKPSSTSLHDHPCHWLPLKLDKLHLVLSWFVLFFFPPPIAFAFPPSSISFSFSLSLSLSLLSPPAAIPHLPSVSLLSLSRSHSLSALLSLSLIISNELKSVHRIFEYIKWLI